MSRAKAVDPQVQGLLLEDKIQDLLKHVPELDIFDRAVVKAQ